MVTREPARRPLELHTAPPQTAALRLSCMPVIRCGDLAFSAARTPPMNGTPVRRGCLGLKLTAEMGRVTVGIAASMGEFNEHPLVVVAPSTLLSEIAGGVCGSARSAIGALVRPRGAAAELGVTLRASEDR